MDHTYILPNRCGRFEARQDECKPIKWVVQAPVTLSGPRALGAPIELNADYIHVILAPRPIGTKKLKYLGVVRPRLSLIDDHPRRAQDE